MGLNETGMEAFLAIHYCRRYLGKQKTLIKKQLSLERGMKPPYDDKMLGWLVQVHFDLSLGYYT